MEIKQVIVVRHDLNMRKGKIAAQVAHASLAVILNEGNSGMEKGDLVFRIPSTSPICSWINGTFTKICLYVESEKDLEILEAECQMANIPHCLITDSGKTEFNGVPTKTCIGIGPWYKDVIDKITGNLKLL